MQPNDGRVVSNFILQALNNEPITIYGDGSQTRSFCYVDDLIDGLYKLMQTDKTISGPINIGNTVENTMVELAQMIIELSESKSELVFKSLPQDDPKQRQPDIQKANSLLAWNPNVDLVSGLNSTINYVKNLTDI